MTRVVQFVGLAIKYQWRCDSITEYHQIKNNNLRFSMIVLNRVYDFVTVFLEVALQLK